MWTATGGLLKGLLVPAGGVVLLYLVGRFMPEPDFLGRSSPKPRLISGRTAGLLAAAVPVLVGVGIVTAAVPEFALNRNRGEMWPLAWLAALIPIGGLLYAVDHLLSHERNKPTTDVDQLAQRVHRIVITGGILVLPAAAILIAAKPDFHSGLTGAWLIVMGASIAALGHGAFYMFHGDAVGEGEASSTLTNHAPASLLPGITGSLSRLERIAWVIWGTAIAIVMVLTWTRPVTVPQAIGGFQLALLWVLLIGLLAEVLSRGVETTAPPRLFGHLGVRRIPVLVLVVVWIAVVNILLESPAFHDIEVIAAAEPPEHPTIEVVFDEWLARNDPGSSTGATPMVFIAAWGGGIRAGVWTAYVLDCAFEEHDRAAPWDSAIDEDDGPCRRPAEDEEADSGDAAEGVAEESPGESSFALGSVVAMNGISGGSMGIAEYYAYLSEAAMVGQRSPHVWVAGRMDDDFLSAALARLLYVDMPLGLLGGTGSIPDRGDIMQDAWEAAWPGGEMSTGLGALRRDQPQLPLAMFSSTSIDDGCAVNMSLLDATSRGEGGVANDCRTLVPFVADDPGASSTLGTFAATHDLSRILCPDQDIRLSAAALASARFPGITPAGRLVPCDEPLLEGLPSEIHLMDGGHLDASSMLGVVQLWEAFEPLVTQWNLDHPDSCIAPVLIHTQNGFKDLEPASASASAPNQWFEPLLFPLLGAKGGLEQTSIQRAALEFSEPMVTAHGLSELVATDGGETVPRLAFIRTRARAGAIVPLGWALSLRTMQGLAAQLGQNQEEFDLVERWLDGGLECRTISGGG